MGTLLIYEVWFLFTAETLHCGTFTERVLANFLIFAFTTNFTFTERVLANFLIFAFKIFTIGL